MFAIVDLNGQQIQVEAGRFVDVDLQPNEADSALTLDKVQLVIDPEGKTLVGAPYVEGATVKAKVMKHFKGSKLRVYKMRPKKGYRRTQGHRQQYTRLMIEAVDVAS